VKTSRRSVIRTAAAISGLAIFDNVKRFQLHAQSAALPGHTAKRAGPAVIELCSPKDGDQFDVAKPLFFWTTSPHIKRYSLFVDGAKVAEVRPSSVPVMSYGLTTSLAPGTHKWRIKGTTAFGKSFATPTGSFTVAEPAEVWPVWAIGPFQRYGKNPLVVPSGAGWESVNTFNPGVLFDQGKFRMLYRAQAKSSISREGYAESTDGVTFIQNPEPLIDATEPFEHKYGCEDARFFKYHGTYYTFYTGNTPANHIALCEATSTDGVTWKKLGPIVENTKNGALICDPFGTPVKIEGKFAMFVGNSSVGICYSEDLVKWGPVTPIDMKLPPGWVAPYEPCVAVADHSPSRPDDVVLFIAGTLNGKGRWFYAISEALFSKTDLGKKVEQLDDCIMKPSEPYESGQNKNCLWTNCIIQHDGQWMLYYGAGDRYVALATVPVK
jgi:predicted GH43/DUF377 family glycosyl hydrolase